jgi:uncharacterized membrane protein YgdD (TMEM256/DUF423 family)
MTKHGTDRIDYITFHASSFLLLVFGVNPLGRYSVSAPNKACTRLVGVCAFSGTLRGFKLIPSKWRCLVPPTRK